MSLVGCFFSEYMLAVRFHLRYLIILKCKSSIVTLVQFVPLLMRELVPFIYLFIFCRWPAMCIHGDKSQPERDWVLTGAANALPRGRKSPPCSPAQLSDGVPRVFSLAEFRSGKAPILIATDVASRGLGMSCVPAWTSRAHAHRHQIHIWEHDSRGRSTSSVHLFCPRSCVCHSTSVFTLNLIGAPLLCCWIQKTNKRGRRTLAV